MTNKTIEAWHHVIASRDTDALDELLADSVAFHSPVVYRAQKGKQLTRLYLTAALHVLLNDSFTYVRQIIGEQDAALEFRVEVEDVEINGVDLIRWDEDGRIVDFKVMLRPLRAINLVRERMAAMLEAAPARGEP